MRHQAPPAQIAAPLPLATSAQILSSASITADVFPEGKQTLADIAFSGQEQRVQVADQVLTLRGHDLAHYLLGRALAVVYELLGIRPENYPSKTASQTIARTLYRRFPTFCRADFVDAFVRAIAGDFPADLETWGRVELAFLMRVLHAYRRWRDEPPPAPKPKPAAYLPASRRAELLAQRPASDRAVKGILLDNYRDVWAAGTLRVLHVLADECWDLVVETGLELVGLGAYPYQRRRELLDHAKGRVAAAYNEGLARDAARLDAQAAWGRYPARCHTEACRLALGVCYQAWRAAGIAPDTLGALLGERLCLIAAANLHEVADLSFRPA